MKERLEKRKTNELLWVAGQNGSLAKALKKYFQDLSRYDLVDAPDGDFPAPRAIKVKTDR